MLKIKVFDCECEKDLEKEINLFIEEISKQDKEVIDIKFSTSITESDDGLIFCFSALVMYDNKLIKEYIPKKYEKYQNFIKIMKKMENTWDTGIAP